MNRKLDQNWRKSNRKTDLDGKMADFGVKKYQKKEKLDRNKNSPKIDPKMADFGVKNTKKKNGQKQQTVERYQRKSTKN